MKRRDFIAGVGGAVVVWPCTSLAQQPAMPMIGFLHGGSPEHYARYVTSFRQSLNETGFVEGRNVAIEYRWAEEHPDRLMVLATDLASRPLKKAW